MDRRPGIAMAEGTDGPLSRFIPARAPGFDSISEGSGYELLVHFYIDAAGVGQMTGNPWSSCGACARVRDAVIGFQRSALRRKVRPLWPPVMFRLKQAGLSGTIARG